MVARHPLLGLKFVGLWLMVLTLGFLVGVAGVQSASSGNSLPHPNITPDQPVGPTATFTQLREQDKTAVTNLGEGEKVGQARIKLGFSGFSGEVSLAEGDTFGTHQIFIGTGFDALDHDLVINLQYTPAHQFDNPPATVTLRAGERNTDNFSALLKQDDIIEHTVQVFVRATAENAFFEGATSFRQGTLNDTDQSELTVSEMSVSTVDDFDTALVRAVSKSEVPLVEEDEPIISLTVRMSHQVDGQVRIPWAVGRTEGPISDRNFQEAEDRGLNFEVLSDPLVFPANSNPGATRELRLRLLDDDFDEDVDHFELRLFDPVSSFHVTQVAWNNPVIGRHWAFATSAGDFSDISRVEVSEVGAVVGDSDGGSSDRAVTVSWGDPSVEGGVFRYWLEAVPAPPSGVEPFWGGDDLVSGSVWEVDSRSGVLSGLAADSDYAVRVVPGGYRSYVRGVGSDWVRVATASLPVLGFENASALSADEGGSVSVEVGLGTALWRTADEGEEDPSDLAFRVVPFVGEGDSLDMSELPDAVEGMVAAGETNVSVSLEVADDMLVEGDETFSVRLEPVLEMGEVAQFSAGEPVGVTVTDDDEGPVTVSAAGGFRSSTVFGLVEGGTTDQQWGVFTVSVTEALGSVLLVDWELGEGVALEQIQSIQDGSGMSVPLSDSGVVQIAAGTTSGEVSLRLADDELAEGEDDLSVVFSNLRFEGASRTRSGGGFPVGFDGGVAELSASVVMESSDQDMLTNPSAESGMVDSNGVGWIRGDRLGRDADRMVTVRWSDTGLAQSGRTGYRIRWGVHTGRGFDQFRSASLMVSDPDMRSVSLGGLDPDGSYQVEVTELLGGVDGTTPFDQQVSTGNAITLGWSSPSATIAEGGSFPLVVTLSAARSVPVAFQLGVVGEGSDDLDAEDLEQEIVVGAGETSGNLAVPIDVLDDEVVEGTETIAIELMETAEQGLQLPDNFEVTITDTDVATLSMAVDTDNVAEDRVGRFGDNNVFVLELSLDKVVAAPVTANLTFGGIGVLDSDLDLGLATSVAIPTGESSVSVPVEVIDDDDTEDAESVDVLVSSLDVTLEGRTNPVVASGTQPTIRIEASDVPAPAVSAVTASAGVDLGGTMMDTHDRIGAAWTAPSDMGGVAGYVARFTPAPTGGSEPAPGDWLFGGEVSDPMATSLTIESYLGLEAGTSYLVEVSARVWGGTPSFSWVRATQPVMLAEVPSVSLSGPAGSVAEAAEAKVMFTASLSAPVSREVEFTVSTTGVEADLDSDFVGLISQRVIIPAGQTSASFVVELLEDEVVETSETFTVAIDPGSTDMGIAIGSPSTVLATISDDDTAQVSVDSGMANSLVVEDVDGGPPTSVVIDFSLDNLVTASVSVGWRIITNSDLTAADITGSLTGNTPIPANTLTGSATVVIADDTVAENEERLAVEITTVSVPLTGRTTPVTASADRGEVAFIIAASDQPASAAGQISNVRITAGASNGYNQDRALTVHWDVPTDTANLEGYEIQFAQTGSSPTWMDATTVTNLADTSYTFRPSELSSPVTLSAGQQYIAQMRTQISGGTKGDWVSSISLPATIIDPLTITIVSDDVSVLESDEEGVLVEFALSGPYSFRISNTNIGVTRDHTGGISINDYTVIFPDFDPGDIATSFKFIPQDNEVFDGDRTFTVSLLGEDRNVSYYSSQLNSFLSDDIPIKRVAKTVTVTFVDDDKQTPLPTNVAMSTTDAQGGDLGDRSFRATWTAPEACSENMNMQPCYPAGVEVSGYAVSFARVRGGALGWSEEIMVVGETTEELTVDLGENLPAGEYRVRVRSVVEGAEWQWAEAPGSVMIGDPVIISLAAEEYVGMEGESFGGGCPTVQVLLSEAASVPVRFGLTGIDTDDFVFDSVVGAIVPGEDSWEGGVCLADDQIVEGVELVDMELSVLSGEVAVGELSSARLRVIDDEQSLVSIQTATPNVTEDVVPGGTPGNEISLEVELSEVLTEPVAVGLEFSGDGIMAGDLTSDDITVNGLAATATIPAGDESVSFTVMITDDSNAEPEQTLTVSVTELTFPGVGLGENAVVVDESSDMVEITIAASDGYTEPSGGQNNQGGGPNQGGGTNPGSQNPSTPPAGGGGSNPGAQPMPPPTVSGPTVGFVAPTSLTVTEGESVSVEIRLSESQPMDVVVNVSVVLNPAAIAMPAELSDLVFVDVTVGFGQVIAVTVEAGAMSKALEFMAVDDGLVEGSEMFRLLLDSVDSPVVLASGSQELEFTIQDAVSGGTGNGNQGNGNQGNGSQGNGSQGGQTTQPTQPPSSNNGGNGQTTQPTQPSTGGNGQSQSPSTSSPSNQGSQPTGSPSSPGGQPTGSSPTSPGVQPNTGGGGVPPGGVAGPSPTGDAASGTTFIDTIGNTHETNIGMLADLGITRGCNPPSNTRYCPDRAVTRGEMATFMVRAFDLAESSENLFGDDDGNTHESNINRLATAEITRGCNPPENSRYCPDRPVTRAQMATFLARALDLAEGSGDFTDTADSVHSNDINRIATVGITRGCNPPTNSRYCPDRPVTRAEMATFLIRATDLEAS